MTDDNDMMIHLIVSGRDWRTSVVCVLHNNLIQIKLNQINLIEINLIEIKLIEIKLNWFQLI